MHETDWGKDFLFDWVRETRSFPSLSSIACGLAASRFFNAAPGNVSTTRRKPWLVGMMTGILSTIVVVAVAIAVAVDVVVAVLVLVAFTKIVRVFCQIY